MAGEAIVRAQEAKEERVPEVDPQDEGRRQLALPGLFQYRQGRSYAVCAIIALVSLILSICLLILLMGVFFRIVRYVVMSIWATVALLDVLRGIHTGDRMETRFKLDGVHGWFWVSMSTWWHRVNKFIDWASVLNVVELQPVREFNFVADHRPDTNAMLKLKHHDPLNTMAKFHRTIFGIRFGELTHLVYGEFVAQLTSQKNLSLSSDESVTWQRIQTNSQNMHSAYCSKYAVFENRFPVQAASLVALYAYHEMVQTFERVPFIVDLNAGRKSSTGIEWERLLCLPCLNWLQLQR